MRKDRRETNPAFSTRRLKFGTFQTNLDSGCVMSDLDGRLDISWPNTVKLAKLADEMDFELLVPVARWAGFGGKTNPQGPGFECYTWAAGIGASTHHTGVASTSHVILNHPLMAAKQGAAIDHISGGRFTLNIVCGWNSPEMDMFGIPLQPHQDRYDCAEEWLNIVKRLWSENETFDFEGKYYKIRKGYLQPKPIQSAYPAIMNAGASERAKHFATKNCDLVFTTLRNPDPDLNAAHIRSYHTMAREQYGRDVRVWSNAVIVQGETEKEARDFYNYYVHEKGDVEAAMNMVNMMGAEINQRSFSDAQKKSIAELFIAGWGGFPLIGTREQIVDGLLMLSKIGFEGLLLSFPRYEAGMREFRDTTLPLVKQAGLRDFL
jgi:alkanesulfonate monooxygenase SsuD/methylene tetrahydromethanopterin reductase-like flavin-dependent oxidoreductase (luciferase family)